MYIMYSIVGLKTNYMYTANLDAAKIYNRNFDEWGGLVSPNMQQQHLFTLMLISL